MTRLLKNSRHEKFAQGVASGLSAIEAYEQAGYKANRQHAHRLATKGDVRERIAEIQASISEKAEWTSAERLNALKEIAERNKVSDPRVSVSAIAEANKMQGSHAPSKTQTKVEGGDSLSALLEDIARNGARIHDRGMSH
ncbi:terminase small subunit [Roseibium sp. MMSF_3544]|uniref:terminase small subunit n=1 Tax=unclassified Roseibium TaxID=2629323 RepID=UPI00273F6D29|nr:terminase small subunit [Roseibium sp. MMSF_3544]